MAVEALTPEEIVYLKKTASACRMSTADFVRNIVREFIRHDKHKPNYRFTPKVEEADPEEAAEILALIEGMTEDDHEVVRVHKI